jgi:hypothetical protein
LLGFGNLKPNIKVATPQGTYTKIAVPRNSTASFRIMCLFPSIRHGVIAGAGRAHATPTLPARRFQIPHPKKVVT